MAGWKITPMPETDRSGGVLAVGILSNRLGNLCCLLIALLFSMPALHAQTAPADATLLSGSQASGSQQTEALQLELSADDQSVISTLRNNSDSAIAVLTWRTPFGDALDADVFSIRDTEVLPGLDYELPYNSLLFKRADPLPAHFVIIESGQSISARTRLASYYAVDIESTYRVQYRGVISYLPADEVAGQFGPVSAKLLRAALASNSVDLNLQVPPATRAAVAPGFNECSASEQSVLQSALLSAENIARTSVIALGSLNVAQRASSPRYLEWFGQYSDTRFNIVRTGYDNLLSTLENTQIDFVCGCTRAQTFAFINRTRPFEINLCPVFWTSTENGRDSRAGTIIHELSHFNEVIGTFDFQYGQTDSRQLAIDNPDQAVFNADNYEYFAENTPALPIVAAGGGNGIATLSLNVEQSGSLGQQQSRFFTVSGAESIELTSVSGDADLYIRRDVNDASAVCESTTTAPVDVCNVEALPTVIVQVFGYTAADFRIVARSSVVTVQGGGNAGTGVDDEASAESSASSDNGGSVSIAMWLVALLALIIRTYRGRAVALRLYKVACQSCGRRR
jgi:peptidyl-Lys metalloendopeptidase